ncbi:zinc ribbon domain-containing protein [Christensenella timonensis]|uniref:zinc ribbon domain-containing protein n=1 Tax=Christensenella timonensis TaxID=1816678 RepID=UPI00082CA0D7|nr:zinc ribbon domain-containing protein [Christensenella timonensis]
MVIKTIALQIHKPTAEKRKVMDRAIGQYNDAMGYLLEHTKGYIPDIVDEMHSGASFLSRRITALLSKELMDSLNDFGVQPFKDSLKLDYAMTMIAWIALRRSQKNARYPRLVREGRIADRAIHELLCSYDGGGIGRRALEAQLKKLYDGLHMKKPILFGRYAKNRDYCLLYDEQKDRFYAKLYLMNVRDEGRRGGIMRGNSCLRYVAGDGGLLEKDNKRERYLVLPLSFGKEQQKVLRQGLSDPSIFKTARLKEKNGKYYLLVNTAAAPAKSLPEKTFLGVTRSLVAAARYAVVDQEGRLVAERTVRMPEAPSKNDFHTAAKQIVLAAQEHKSKIVSYHLGHMGDQLSREGRLACLTAGQFNKLMSMVSYKAELKGLARPVTVSPRGLFYTCPRCGANTLKNRFMQDKFLCVKCGFAGETESVGAANAARRLQKYGGSLLPFEASVAHGRITLSNKILDIRYETDYTREAIDGFYDYIGELVEKWKANGNAPIRAGAKKISYYKKFIGITNPREEIAIVDVK